jgi:hypothetical protein
MNVHSDEKIAISSLTGSDGHGIFRKRVINAFDDRKKTVKP